MCKTYIFHLCLFVDLKQKYSGILGSETILPTIVPQTSAYACFFSQSTSSSGDRVECFDIVDSLEAARLACRDHALQKKEEEFTFDHPELESEFFKLNFENGIYDNGKTKYRYKVWFQGPMQIKKVDDFPDLPDEEEEEERVTEEIDAHV